MIPKKTGAPFKTSKKQHSIPFRHSLDNKYVEYRNTLIYGRNANSGCDERTRDVNPTAKLTGIGYHTPSAGTLFKVKLSVAVYS